MWVRDDFMREIVPYFQVLNRSESCGNRAANTILKPSIFLQVKPFLTPSLTELFVTCPVKQGPWSISLARSGVFLFFWCQVRAHAKHQEAAQEGTEEDAGLSTVHGTAKGLLHSCAAFRSPAKSLASSGLKGNSRETLKA